MIFTIAKNRSILYCIINQGGLQIMIKNEYLQKLMETQQPAVFFSPDLCAKYFTYTCGDAIRFVLFDDAETLRKKIHMGRELGIHTGFVLYPETEDLLPQLFQ